MWNEARGTVEGLGWLVTPINERLQRTQVTCNLFEHGVEWQWSWNILHAFQLKNPARAFFYIYPCVHYFYISCFRTFCWHENCESELKCWHGRLVSFACIISYIKTFVSVQFLLVSLVYRLHLTYAHITQITPHKSKHAPSKVVNIPQTH